jgi:glycosyltransferase involved in cell wall biosynthesis
MILLFQRWLAPYRVPLFRRLSEALEGRLTVASGQPPAGRAADPAGFAHVPLRNRWIGGEAAVWQHYAPAFRAVPRPQAIIIEHNPRILSLCPLLRRARRQGAAFILWGHGVSQRRQLDDRDWRQRVQNWLLSRCDAYVAYTDERRALLESAFGGGRFFHATNTLDTQTLFAARRRLEVEGLSAVRARLGLARGHYLCFIGRLHRDKQPQAVLALLQALRGRGLDVGAIFIGEGPERAALQAAAGDAAVFTGAIDDLEASAPWLFASDILVMPHWAGLAVNHGLALGLPILTQADAPGLPAHPPEIAYVRDGDTGFVVPYGDAAALADAAARLIAERGRFRTQAIAYAESRLGIDDWVRGMCMAIEAGRRHAAGR